MPTFGCLVSCLLIGLLIDAARADEADAASVAGEILELLLKETPKPNYGAPVPAKITGQVLLHATGTTSGAAGVSVTDGYSVVKTDSQGSYTLTPHPDAVFVTITRPSGFDIKGDWYCPLAAEVDFALKPASQGEDEYIFVHVTDTHVSQNRRSLVGLSRFVREVNALTPRPRFVVNSGDLLNLNKALLNSPAEGRADFRNYVGIMNHLTMPSYNVAGDHTDSSYRLDEFPRGDHRCGKPLYWEHLGPHFFSFEYGKIHFVSVDFGYHLGKRQMMVNGKQLESPTNEVQPMHVAWMRQDMTQRTAGTFVVTTSEADLAEHCPGFLAISAQNDVRLQLVGDIHVVSEKTRPVPYRTGGALAGCWWNPKANQLCPDLSPQGYLIYRVADEKLDYFYKGLGQRVAFVSHRVGAAWQGRVTLEAHLVQPQPDEALEYSLDGKNWQAMHEVGRPFYRAHYSAGIDSTALPDGLLNCRVRSTATGEVRSREIVVVNGGAPSKFETDATLSFAAGSGSGWASPSPPAGKVDVLFNGQSIGVLDAKTSKEYTFRIPASHLRQANILSFRFSQPNDGMILSSPVLILQGQSFRDSRDDAIRQVRTGHWGSDAADWGGFIAGEAEPPDETPFHRRQNVFCFVLGSAR